MFRKLKKHNLDIIILWADDLMRLLPATDVVITGSETMVGGGGGGGGFNSDTSASVNRWLRKIH